MRHQRRLFRRQHAEHAAVGEGALGADGEDLRVGLLAAHERRVHGAGQADVVDVVGAAGEEAAVLAPRDALADVLGRAERHRGARAWWRRGEDRLHDEDGCSDALPPAPPHPASVGFTLCERSRGGDQHSGVQAACRPWLSQNACGWDGTTVPREALDRRHLLPSACTASIRHERSLPSTSTARAADPCRSSRAPLSPTPRRSRQQPCGAIEREAIHGQADGQR